MDWELSFQGPFVIIDKFIEQLTNLVIPDGKSCYTMIIMQCLYCCVDVANASVKKYAQNFHNMAPAFLIFVLSVSFTFPSVSI